MSSENKIKLTENALKVLEARYLRKDETGKCIETPEDLFRRVAKCVASVETQYAGGNPAEAEEIFYDLMTSGKFMPNSPTLMNAGREMGMLSACFVLPLEDSIDGIFSTVKAAAMIQKAGGGTGFSFDKLRPSGDFIKSSGGTTSGPMSFWKVLSEATNAIQQGAFRRGANMGMMSIDHPDILTFIYAKQDLTAFTNFNISVKIPDEFMVKYKEDPDGAHVVVNKRNGKKYMIPKTAIPGKYEIKDLIPYEDVVKIGSCWSRKEIFGVILECAWKTGEPGLIFIDEVARGNSTPNVGEIEATNPCVTGDTKILTDKGFFPIQDLVGQTVNVWNGFEWSEVEPRVTGENQKIMLVKFSDGSELKVTPYHNFLLQNGQKRDNKEPIRTKAKDLKSGDRLAIFEHPIISGEKTEDSSILYTRGVFCGDGSHHTSSGKDSIWLYGEKVGLLDKLSYRYANECAGDRVHVCLEKSLDFQKNFVPGAEWCIKSRMDWLSGLIDSDGSVTPDGQVQIWSVDKEFLQNVREMLMFSGAHSSLSLGKEASTKFMPDGRGGSKEYRCQESWRLSIPLWAVCVLKKNGLMCNRVDISKGCIQKNFSIRVVSTEQIDQIAEKVYCFTEYKRHAGTFGCVVGGNCGEQPLLPYEACNLGSINVASFVMTSDSGEVYFDWGGLSKSVRESVRFLDNVIEANRYPLPEIEAMCKGNRKIGLGLMGFADALFLLGIPYNSQDGVDFGTLIMEHIDGVAHSESSELAKERGVFPNWHGSCFQEEVAGSWYGIDTLRRNAATTTVAPTGTISIIADCSGGIEPLFSLAFVRQVLNGQKLIEINPIFEKVAKDRGFYSQELMEKIAETGTIAHMDGIPDDVKRVFVCSHDISPEWHIKMQAAFQKHCDSSISKTINLPHDATVADVEQAYMMAWELRCKGVTVYRDGCRSMQPMSLAKKEEPKEQPKEEKRTAEDWKQRKPVKTPLVAPGVRVRQSTPFGHMHVNVTVDPVTKREIEIFAQLGKAGDVAASDLEAIGRLCSLYLRIGGSLEDIVKQLEGIGSHMSIPTKDGRVMSLADALAKALQKYKLAKDVDGLEGVLLGVTDISQVSLKESAKPGSSDTQQNSYKVKCPECGGTLSFSEGCIKCPSCGYSKC